MTSLFCGSPTSEESALDGAEQEWCTSLLQRLGEAKRPHFGTFLARHTFLEVPTSFSAPFQAIFKPFFVVQFHACPWQFLVLWLVCHSVLLVGLSPRESLHDAASDLILTCFTVNLQCFHSFMFLVPWRRCVGKQTPAAPEVQLRDDVQFFRLHVQPNHQNTRICWSLPCLAIVLYHSRKSWRMRDIVVSFIVLATSIKSFFSMYFW